MSKRILISILTKQKDVLLSLIAELEEENQRLTDQLDIDDNLRDIFALRRVVSTIEREIRVQNENQYI